MRNSFKLFALLIGVCIHQSQARADDYSGDWIIVGGESAHRVQLQRSSDTNYSIKAEGLVFSGEYVTVSDGGLKKVKREGDYYSDLYWKPAEGAFLLDACKNPQSPSAIYEGTAMVRPGGLIPKDVRIGPSNSREALYAELNAIDFEQKIFANPKDVVGKRLKSILGTKKSGDSILPLSSLELIFPSAPKLDSGYVNDAMREDVKYIYSHKLAVRAEEKFEQTLDLIWQVVWQNDRHQPLVLSRYKDGLLRIATKRGPIIVRIPAIVDEKSSCGVKPIFEVADISEKDPIPELANRIREFERNEMRWGMYDWFTSIRNFAKANRRDVYRYLDSGDPKIKTLALFALYALDDPSLLPLIWKKGSKDQRISFEICEPRSSWIGGTPRRCVPATVAEFTQVMAEFWMGIPNGGITDRHVAAWQECRKGHPVTADELRRMADLASGGGFPIKPSRAPAVLEVKQKILALPFPKNYFYFLYFGAGRYKNDKPVEEYSDSRILATETELNRAATSLGEDFLLDILRGKQMVDDPTLPHHDLKSAYSYTKLANYILKRSETLLPNSSWSQLEDVFEDPQSISSGWWPAAIAMKLPPSERYEYLKAGLKRFPESYQYDARAIIAKSMYDIAGSAGIKDVIDWFFAERPEGCCVSGQSVFISSLERGKEATLIAAIVRDSRFSLLPPYIVSGLYSRLEKWNCGFEIPYEDFKAVVGEWKITPRTADATNRLERNLRAYIDSSTFTSCEQKS